MTITKRNVSDWDLDNAAQYSLNSFSFRDLKSKTMHMTRSSNSSKMIIILSLTVLFSLQAVRGKQMFGASLPTRSPAQWSVESRGSQQQEEEEEGEKEDNNDREEEEDNDIRPEGPKGGPKGQRRPEGPID